MAKPIRFAPTKAPSGWRVNIPAKFSPTGKRQQLFYRTQKLALEARDRFKASAEVFGEQSKAISPTLAEQALAANSLLSKFKGETVLTVVQKWIAEKERETASVTIEKALEAFMKAKEGRSESQLKSYDLMARKLIESFPDRLLSTITASELVTHIEQSTDSSSVFNQRSRLVSAFVRWCAKSPRTWCDERSIASFERKETVAGHIGTLTPHECRTLMETAEKFFPECVVPFAIALFTGMRQKEIMRLVPSDITDNGITIPANRAKTKRRRFISMPEPLAKWLEVYPVGKNVTPPNWTRKEKAVRRLAGWRVWSDLVPALDINPPMTAEPPLSAPEWVDNGLRHTAATVALALGKPIESLLFEHGHSGGLAVLRNHYIGQMTKNDALEIRSIGPKGTKVKHLKTA